MFQPLRGGTVPPKTRQSSDCSSTAKSRISSTESSINISATLDERQNETGGKKSGKKGAFGAITQRLVEAGGGNKSAPSCAGSTTNDGAMQLANLTATLDKCEDDIHAACDPSNFPQPNMTFIDMCDALVAEFKTEAGKCLNQSVGGYKQAASTACDCWTATALNELAVKAKNCKAKDEAGAIATGKDLNNIF